MFEYAPYSDTPEEQTELAYWLDYNEQNLRLEGVNVNQIPDYVKLRSLWNAGILTNEQFAEGCIGCINKILRKYKNEF